MELQVVSPAAKFIAVIRGTHTYGYDRKFEC